MQKEKTLIEKHIFYCKEKTRLGFVFPAKNEAGEMPELTDKFLSAFDQLNEETKAEFIALTENSPELFLEPEIKTDNELIMELGAKYNEIVVEFKMLVDEFNKLSERVSYLEEKTNFSLSLDQS